MPSVLDAIQTVADRATVLAVASLLAAAIARPAHPAERELDANLLAPRAEPGKPAPSPPAPPCLAVADLDRDGDFDLVATVTGSRHVAILLNETERGAPISFAAAPSLVAPPGPIGVGDLDGDGFPDLVHACRESGILTWYRNRGGGDFELARDDLRAGERPWCAAIADLDRDTDLDVVIASNDKRELSVLVNQGDGDLAPSGHFSTGVSVRTMAVGDLDGDRVPDVAVVADDGSTILAFLNDGAGALGVVGGSWSGARSRSIAIADLDGGGRGSLVVAHDAIFADDVSVLARTSNGEFESRAVARAGDEVALVATGDLDRDGRRELIVASGRPLSLADGRLVVLRDTPPEGYKSRDATIPAGAVALAVADFDGDGADDVAVAIEEPLGLRGDEPVHARGHVVFLRNDGRGELDEPSGSSETGDPPSAVVVADIDSDDRLDVVAVQPDLDRVAVLYGDADAQFHDVRHVAVGDRPGHLAVRLIDPNFRPDLVTADVNGDTVTVLYNEDGTRFDRATYGVSDRPGGLVVENFGGAGLVDLAVAGLADGILTTLMSGDDGRFVRATHHYIGRVAVAAATLNFDNDDKTDLAFLRLHASSLVLVRNLGDGAFAPLEHALPGPAPAVLLHVALDGSERGNLVVANRGGSVIDILADREGEMSFRDRTSFTVGSGVWSIATGDLDGDDSADLAVSARRDDTVWVLLNRGAGRFARRSAYDVGDEPGDVRASDLDGDGALDLVVAAEGDRAISVLRNRGAGRFGPEERWSTVVVPRALVIRDLDGDDDRDVLVFDAESRPDAVVVLWNVGSGTFDRPQTFSLERPTQRRR